MGSCFSWLWTTKTLPGIQRDTSTDTNEDILDLTKKMGFKKAFLTCISYLDLSDRDKVFISLRFINIVEDLERKHKMTLTSYNIHRLLILLSGILVPVLITIKDNIPEPAAVFWITLLVSVSGSISNAWMEYFSVVKMHFTYMATVSALKREGWNYVSLSGRYIRYRRHDQCFARFSNSVEKIHMKGINMYMLNSTHVRDTGGMNGKMTMEEAGIFDLIKNYPLSTDGEATYNMRPGNVSRENYSFELTSVNDRSGNRGNNNGLEIIQEAPKNEHEEDEEDDLAFPEDSEPSMDRNKSDNEVSSAYEDTSSDDSSMESPRQDESNTP